MPIPEKPLREIKELLAKTVKKKDGTFPAPRPLDAVAVMRKHHLAIDEILQELTVDEVGLFLFGVESLKKRGFEMEPSQDVIHAFRQRYLRMAGKILD